MSTMKLTPEIIAAAIDGFQAQKNKIDQQIAELRQMLEGRPAEPEAVASEQPKRKRRKLSAAGRAAIVAAVKKRWAEKNAAKAAPAAAKKVATKKSAAKKVAKAAKKSKTKVVAPKSAEPTTAS